MKTSLFLLALLFSLCSFSQSSEMAKKVFILINEARTNPSAFLTKYKSSVEKFNPTYAKTLKTQKAVKPAIWDSGLETMAKSSVEEHNLNPIYKGKTEMCGKSSGSGSGSQSKEAIYYVCDFYTNVHDADYKYFGIYFNKTSTNYSFQWGISCEREKIKYVFKDKIDTSSVDYNKLNTGKTITYMSQVEKNMLSEINLVRAYPKLYAKIIAKYLATESDSPFGITKDTYDAGVELINELNNLPSLSILSPSECVYKAAKQHGIDCQKRGFIDHEGSDKSMPWDRILKHCIGYKNGSENMAGNANENPRYAVISLLLDNGISSRGHRRNLIDPNWKYCACYRYADKTYGYQWVQNFAY
jgi:uncharacterized protein YkwD